MRFFALDFWQGSDANADLYQDLAEITFPVLLNADPLGAPDQYNCSYHYVFIVDHNGLVQYRGSVNMPVLEAVMAEAVSRLPVGVGVEDQLPAAAARLQPPYPNPFNPQTTIAFEVAPEGAGQPLRLEVLDLRGRVVRTLATGSRGEGRHEVVFDGRDQRGERLASGVYLARLRVAGSEQTQFLTMVK